MPDYVCIAVPHFIGEWIEARTEISAIKQSGFAERLNAPWVDVAPDFDAIPDPVLAVNHALSRAIRAHPDRTPIIFAADCVSALGAVHGLRARPTIQAAGLGVVWYDAHGDFNTPETTPSGFLGGMPLAMLVGRGDLGLLRGLGLDPLPEADVIITDARDLDPAEGVALANSQIRHLRRVEDLLNTSLPPRPLYIHLDVDVVDPDLIPGMSYPAPGGPTVAQVAATLTHIAQQGQVAGLLLSLWNDALTTDRRALEGTLALLNAFVEGHNRHN